MMKNSKKGFNLIEIAIVLAVVGLVIGGIYVAAASVTDNQRKQKAQSQLLTIVQNMRNTYSNQPFSATPAVADLQAARVVPADISVSGNNMSGAYGSIAIARVTDDVFSLTLGNVTEGGCIDFLTKNFGTASQINQIGLDNITVGATVFNEASPGTIASANTACNATNTMVFNFRVRA